MALKGVVPHTITPLFSVLWALYQLGLMIKGEPQIAVAAKTTISPHSLVR